MEFAVLPRGHGARGFLPHPGDVQLRCTAFPLAHSAGAGASDPVLEGRPSRAGPTWRGTGICPATCDPEVDSAGWTSAVFLVFIHPS